jgi:hypothetical protein
MYVHIDNKELQGKLEKEQQLNALGSFCLRLSIHVLTLVGDGESARGQREMNTRKRLRET